MSVVVRCTICGMIDRVSAESDERSPMLPVAFCVHCTEPSVALERYDEPVVPCRTCRGDQSAWCTACSGTGIEQEPETPSDVCAECTAPGRWRRRHACTLCDAHAYFHDRAARERRLYSIAALLKAQDEF